MKKYVILALVILPVYFVISFLMPSGGIGADSLSYFGIASDLPKLKTNLFPLGFPFFIEIFNRIFGDYFWAAKISIFLLTATILIFSYHKKFYFRETVLLFTGKTFVFIFTGIISESLFVFLLYFLFYFLHQILVNKLFKKSFVIAASMILILMFAVRYSGLYILSALVFFWIFSWVKDRNQAFLKPILAIIILSGMGILSYLMFNYLNFGSFTGENLRGKPEEILPVDVFRNILGLVNAVDPYIGIKPASNSFLSLGFQTAVFAIDIFILIYYIKFLKKSKKSGDYVFHSLLMMIGIFYALFLFFSGFVQQIEEMNTRMLAAANVCFFFSFLILYFKHEKNTRLIFTVGCFFFVFLSVYTVKSPVDFLSLLEEIRPQMKKFNAKRYLFNNETDLKTFTSYHFPLVGKTVKYEHTANQQGSVKMNIAGSLNPQIKWILNDTVKDKSKVLYTSDLHLQLKTEER